MITLSQLLEVFPDERFQVYSQAALGVSIDDVTADSRLVRPGSLFVAVAGGQHDGHRYIEVALKQGAAAVVGALSGEALRSAGVTLPETVPYIQVGDSRRALALASAAVSDFPSRKLAVAGITGTDGKTTTSSILESILQAATSLSLIHI